MMPPPAAVVTAAQPAFVDFYRGRHVLVTGHTGFKGAWLSLWLSELGARVHGFALPPPTAPSLFEEAGVRERLASHAIGDVCDVAAVARAVRDATPDVVLHLAAQPLVRRSYREPRETFDTNVMGTVNVLEAVRSAGGDAVRVCQVITSDKCYENRGWVWPYREADPMGGADPYSASKGCAELVVAAYRRSFFPPEEAARHGVSLSTARAGNVIGGGDWAEDRIIPDCVRALARDEPVQVRNPSAVRPWQHVLEPLSGYLMLAARQGADPGGFADGWNFGPLSSGNVTVREVVELVVDEWGSGSWADRSDTTGSGKGGGGPHEAHTLKLDVSKAAAMLGWRPQLTVSDAVRQTIRWYRARACDGAFDAASACLAQVRAYEVGLIRSAAAVPVELE